MKSGEMNRSRCEPSAGFCMRRAECDRSNPQRQGQVIDASVCVSELGYCPLFVAAPHEAEKQAAREKFAADPRFAAWVAAS